MRIEELIDDEELRRKVENISENDVVVFSDLGHVPDDASFRTEAFIVLLCLRGQGIFSLGDRRVEIHSSDLVLVPHQQLVSNVTVSLDFSGKGLMMSADYLESVFLLTGKFWPAGFVVKTNPVIHLSDEEMRLCIESCDYLESKLNQPRTEHYTEMMQLLLRAMIFDFYDHVASKLQLPVYSYTSSESIFGRFMKMAEAETPRHRDVGYYASRLCITPKYLSVVCRNMVGKPASDILNGMTVEYIKTQLRSTDKTVKEIAAEAGFDNLSFFGKYVRRELGMSPRDYRTH